MNEQNKKLTQVKKSCRTAERVSRIVMVLMIVIAVICTIAAGCCLAFRTQIDQAILANAAQVSFDTQLEFGGLLHLTANIDYLLDSGEYTTVLLLYCGLGVLVSIFVAAIFGMICRVFTIIRQSESPFREEVIHSMKKIFITLFVLTLFFVGVGIALLVGLLLRCIYCIMDYGMILQTEVDDTI